MSDEPSDKAQALMARIATSREETTEDAITIDLRAWASFTDYERHMLSRAAQKRGWIMYDDLANDDRILRR